MDTCFGAMKAKSNPMPLLLRFAYKTLRQSGWSPELSDKDSGFVLVPAARRDAVLENAMRPDWYERAWRELTSHPAIRRNYDKVVDEITRPRWMMT